MKSNTTKLIDDFCKFLTKENKNLKIDSQTSHWYLKFKDSKLTSQPALLKIYFSGDEFVIDNYKDYFKFKDFKEFKNKTVEIMESEDFKLKMKMLKSFCK
jgi:hypothetical protein